MSLPFRCIQLDTVPRRRCGLCSCCLCQNTCHTGFRVATLLSADNIYTAHYPYRRNWELNKLHCPVQSSSKSVWNSYFGRLIVLLLDLDWTVVATVFSTTVQSYNGESCLIIQSYLPGDANNTRTGYAFLVFSFFFYYFCVYGLVW